MQKQFLKLFKSLTTVSNRVGIFGVLILISSAVPTQAADLQLFLPLKRTAYQCNEWIDITAIRGSGEALKSGDLVLSLKGEDGSQLSFTFAVEQAKPESDSGHAVEHFHVNGWLLRPGKYGVEVACNGAQAATNIEVFTSIRRSSFKLINWGRAEGKDQLCEGEDNLGYNLFYGNSGRDQGENFIRAGVDFMANCVMSGGHQMDLRNECDWSDPYVIRGGTRRVVRRAFMDRTYPNVPGVHFYDEPGLTWAKDPQTGEMTPHAVPWQHRSFEFAHGQPPISYRAVNPNNLTDARRWAEWTRWKLSLMDAAWKDAQFGVSRVDPEYVSVTQSQYGFSAFCDGYYFNVVRSLPVISGHGGYHDFGPGYFNPSLFLEFARARDFTRPNWYLPAWYDSTPPDVFRLEQYLSFQCNIQGMMSPPDLEPAQPAKSKAAQGIVESNHLMGRLGTIFATMPVTRPPVAVLFSLSQMIHTQTLDRKLNYAHETPHGRNAPFVYLAGKLLQHQFMVVLDEDVLDGTLAAQHKAIILTSLDYLDPQVVGALEAFVKQGGLVLLTADCAVRIAGAVKLSVTPKNPMAEKIDELKRAGKASEGGELGKMRYLLQGAQNLADALRPQLEKAGIKPVFVCDEPGIVATRQAAGDIEYLLAVNATHDPQGDAMIGVKSVTATLGLPADGRKVYDAIHGGPVREFAAKEAQLQGQFRFGPGQMRVFARTTRPIGGIKVAAPIVHRDFTLREMPISLAISAALLDSQGGMLSGSAPLRIQVTDPLGLIRFDLYRATENGIFQLKLPLAINDPPGQWQVTVTELLNRTKDTANFVLAATSTCSALAGATGRAVYFAPDREKVFRLFREHHRVTLVKGAADFHNAAAERIAKILEPWNIQCNIVNAAEVNKPRSLSEPEAATWIGLDYAGRGQIKPGDQNNPALVGFALQGPVILLGSPDDNPLIKVLADQHFLPYQPSKLEMPGLHRGFVAWQRDAVGVEQESITLIAYDAPGLSEAVGTLYDMMAGLEPLTPLVLPRQSALTAANRVTIVPDIPIEKRLVLPDRIVGLKANNDNFTVLTRAGVFAEVDAEGKVVSQKILADAEYQQSEPDLRAPADDAAVADAQKQARPQQRVKLVLANQERKAVAYWGGLVQIKNSSGVLQAAHRFPQDITAMAWSGSRLIIGDADGQLAILKPD